MRLKKAYSFDDVMLVPRLSVLKSRSDVDLTTSVAGVELKIPIIAANMSTVCEDRMAIALGRLGGLGIIHRMCSVKDQAEMVRVAKNHLVQLKDDAGVPFGGWVYTRHEYPVGFSIGIGDDWRDRMDACRHDADIVCLDVAHAHHNRVTDLLDKYFGIYKDFPLIIGQVSTSSAVRELLGHVPLKYRGSVAFKASIGGGSLCTTRIQTGFGVPTLQAVMDIANEFPEISLIADGGIKSSGDIVKSLAAGAQSVMLGSLLAGTNETPGAIFTSHDDLQYKQYRGSASFTDKTLRGEQGRNVEGESTLVEVKGPVVTVIESLLDGVRSGFSYGGALNLEELQDSIEFVEISSQGLKESHAHAIS
jgi:IMP dehydrogenase